MSRLAVLLLLLAGCASRESTIRRAITIEDVVRMQTAGVGSKTIVATIETSDVRATLTIADILGLKEKGLSDEVIAALIKATGPKAVVYEPRPAYYYYRGPVYAPYWW
jgi:hypothetical protein